MALCYIVSVLLHAQFLREVWIGPYIAHDEVQYCLTGEHLRAGDGFTMRGVFASTVPPLYPLFIAFGRSLSDSPRAAFAAVSIEVVCLMIFPLYGIGRDIGLKPSLAILSALAGSFIPQTFYAGMYMSETLQLPLFMLAFWLCMRWLRSAALRSGAVLGAVFGVMTLNRFATWTFIGCFGVVSVATLAWPRLQAFKGQTKRAAWASLALVIGIPVAFQGGWWAYKWMHHVSALGMYGSMTSTWGHAPLELVLAYCADALLAPGLIVAAFFLAGVGRIYRDRPAEAALLAATVGVLVLSTALADGSQTSMLRERYYVYCFPLMITTAVFGSGRYFSSASRWAEGLILFLLPAACLFAVLLYDFHVPPLIESSWAHAVSRLSSGPGVFERHALIRNGLLLIAIVGAAFVFIRRRSMAVATYLLAFNIYACACVGRDVAAVTADHAKMTLNALSLFPKAPTSFQKLVAAGHPPLWDANQYPPEDGFAAANVSAGLSGDLIWCMEIMALLDVRMCGSSSCVENPEFAGRYMLTAVDMPGLELVNIRPPLRLYRIPSKVSEGAQRRSASSLSDLGRPLGRQAGLLRSSAQ